MRHGRRRWLVVSSGDALGSRTDRHRGAIWSSPSDVIVSFGVSLGGLKRSQSEEWFAGVAPSRCRYSLAAGIIVIRVTNVKMPCRFAQENVGSSKPVFRENGSVGAGKADGSDGPPSPRAVYLRPPDCWHDTCPISLVSGTKRPVPMKFWSS